MRTAECSEDVPRNWPVVFIFFLFSIFNAGKEKPGRVKMASDQEFTGGEEDGQEGLALGPHLRR